MTNKLTNKEVLNAVLGMEEVKANPLYVAKIEAMIEAIEKKSANRKPTAKQTENESVKAEILEVLIGSNGMRIAEIMKACAYEFSSNQQCTALVRQLVNEGKVLRIEDKRVTLFRLAEEEEA